MKQWVKLYTEINRDPKMGTLSWAHRGIWSALMALAGEIDERDENDDETGLIGSLADVAWHIRADEELLQEAFAVFAAKNMLHQNDGLFYLTHFLPRQGRPPSSKHQAVLQRVQRHRSQLRQDSNETVTTLQPDVTTLEREKNRVDIDIDSLPANPTQHNDYLDDVLTHAQKPQHPGIADPSQDPARWLQFRKEAIVIYQQQSGLHVIAPANQKAISDLAAEEHFDPERWRKAVESCIRGSVKPANVDCMIDTYHAGGDYKAMQDKRRNGRNDRHNQSSHGLDGLRGNKVMPKAEWDAGQAERARNQALHDDPGRGDRPALPDVRDGP